jgi:hypothetical protein
MLPSNAGGLPSKPPVRHWPVSDPVEFQLGMGKPTLYAQVPPHVTFGQPVGSVSNDELATKMVAANALGTKSNIPTTPQFNAPDITVGDAAFGRITSTITNNREMQFALKYSF